MTRTSDEVDALWRRWRRNFAWATFALTAVIIGAWALLASPGAEEADGGLQNWAKIAAIYAIVVGYGAIQWRAVKRAFLAGKSADEAMRARG